MSWLDRLTKGVEESVNRAATEADKALRLARTSADLTGKKNELDKIYAAIGRTVYEQHQSGATLPTELTSRFSVLETLQNEIKDLEAQREAIKAGTQSAAGTTPGRIVVEEDSATRAFCTSCGAVLPAGSERCPSCGQQIGS